MRNNSDIPVVVCGCGPAGIATSVCLSAKGIDHILLESSVFPRDKICGDAVSGRVVDWFSENLPDFNKSLVDFKDEVLETKGIIFYAPSTQSVSIPFPAVKNDLPPGYVIKRLVFDQLLFNSIDKRYAKVMQSSRLKDISYENGKLNLVVNSKSGLQNISTQLIIGADGAQSIVERKLSDNKKDPNHYCAGLRAYYKGINGFTEGNYIELHFIKELLPGYFWIFPLSNDQANVGLGVLSSHVSKKNVNLRQTFFDLIKNNPVLKNRFKDAVPLSEPKGWGLPMGSRKMQLSGDRFLLTGDAASLIDPFTGEGIGNAMISGKLAAQIAEKALNENDFSAKNLYKYDQLVYDTLWQELKLSHKLQRLTKFPYLFNFVVGKINKNKRLEEVFTNMFADLNLRSEMKNPMFYFKLLFNKL